MKLVEIFTDGACRGNPGPGGWGVLMRYGTEERSFCGGELDTTNNRMELTCRNRRAVSTDPALPGGTEFRLHLCA
jgi:hypothetical protein